VESNLTYDCGKSLNPAIDIGQVEGAFIMGLGEVLRESEQYDKEGKLLTSNTWTYKPPGARDVPQRFVVELIQNEKFEKGILSSKASGEPPLVLAISVAMAVRVAIQSAREDAGLKDWVRLDLPMTPDVIALACGTTDQDLLINPVPSSPPVDTAPIVEQTSTVSKTGSTWSKQSAKKKGDQTRTQ